MTCCFFEIASMRDYLRLIDTHTPGPRNDVTPLFADYEAFTSLVEDLIKPFAKIEFDAVVGIDALGFIVGAAMAFRMKKGFVPIRKGGKLPVETDSVEFMDYTGQRKSLELRTDAIKPRTKVLIVDEWIETGAQVKAAIELVERQSGIIVGIATINMDDNEQTRLIREKYFCHAIWQGE
jgi:adenine phosphoribosyltransferase